MSCQRCGRENPPTAKFCGECGARLTVDCPGCGSPSPAGARFCSACGWALVAEAPAGFGSPTFYTPPHLAERIITSREALQGERKEVTVLLADLKSSMELVAERDLEDARVLLDAVLQRMMAAVHQYEGTVNQVMGDGIMALSSARHSLTRTTPCVPAMRHSGCGRV